jgi:hypothetical protein
MLCQQLAANKLMMETIIKQNDMLNQKIDKIINSLETDSD